MGINLFHDFVIAPAADLHGDLCGDTEVGGEGGKTMAELVDSDALDAGAVAGTLDGAAERHLMHFKQCPGGLTVAINGGAKLRYETGNAAVGFGCLLL